MVYIILVNYNGLKDTLECIDSLNLITYKEFTIIVVDNGSSDDSLKRLKERCSRNVVILDAGSNLGFSGGNNIGIKYAINHDAEYVLLLNNDTIVTPNFLTEMVQTAKQKNNRAIITSKILYEYDKRTIWYAGGNFSYKTSRTSSCGIHELDQGQYDQLKNVSFISGCCMLIPISAINEIGFMEEDYFLYCEDTDYGCRFLEGGYELVYQPLSKIYHKVSASTAKLNSLMNYYVVRNKLEIVRRHVNKRWKVVAYTYLLFETVKRVLCGEYAQKATIKAVQHFLNGTMGKIENL